MVPHPRKATINRTKGHATSDKKQPRSLREIEMEVLEEGREWTRRRLEGADKHPLIRIINQTEIFR